MRITPSTVSVAVYIGKGDKLLLVKQAAPERSGKWSPPAGHLEPGESITQAALRETREETGLEIELVDLIRIYTIGEQERLRVGFTFRGRILGGKMKPEADDVTELRWFTEGEIRNFPEESLYKPDYERQGFADWLSGTSYPLSILKEGP